MKIIFATKNIGKMKEIREIMGDMNIELLSLDDLNIDIDVLEDGATFCENAIKKSVEIMKIAKEIVLSDDSGLEIDFLNGEPGVHSARYLGYDTPYEYKNQIILDKLKDVSWEDRTARFVCSIGVAFTNGEVFTKKGVVEGYINYTSKGENGFGYDPIFYVPEYDKTMAELTISEKNNISHRAKALRLMKECLKSKI